MNENLDAIPGLDAAWAHPEHPVYAPKGIKINWKNKINKQIFLFILRSCLMERRFT